MNADYIETVLGDVVTVTRISDGSGVFLLVADHETGRYVEAELSWEEIDQVIEGIEDARADA